ncbi:MAG TPA: sigma-70 family RNA polymerase sigma factor [Pyrinomonadaceae bacterium]
MPFDRAERLRRFEESAIPHLADVYRLARQMSGAQRAPDLTQEAYLRAWRYFDSFGQGTNCRAWLFQILHNVWHDHRRRSRAEFENSDPEAFVEPSYDWEGEFISEELSEEVERALSQLPEVYRWAVLLADVEELSYREIAEVMGCPVGTVMSRVNRGRRTLARLLRPERV